MSRESKEGKKEGPRKNANGRIWPVPRRLALLPLPPQGRVVGIAGFQKPPVPRVITSPLHHQPSLARILGSSRLWTMGQGITRPANEKSMPYIEEQCGNGISNRTGSRRSAVGDRSLFY